MSSAQVSSMKSNTKLCRFLIDDRRSTVILRRWIGIDRRYRPYSPVSESASSWLTVDIHRDRSTGLINRWISVSMWPGFGTISHHAWDHEFLVDVCPGPFLMTYGTIMIGQWSFFKQRGRLISIRYESTSTIDSSFDRFFSEIDGRCDIDLDKSISRLKSNRPIDDNCGVFSFFLSILCNYRATMEVSSSDEELIQQSTSEFDHCTADKDRGFADAHPRQQRKNGSIHEHQKCSSTPSSSAPKALLQ